jgi:hypothetical protein
MILRSGPFWENCVFDMLDGAGRDVMWFDVVFCLETCCCAASVAVVAMYRPSELVTTHLPRSDRVDASLIRPVAQSRVLCKRALNKAPTLSWARPRMAVGHSCAGSRPTPDLALVCFNLDLLGSTTTYLDVELLYP